jgi:ribosomal protein L37E
MDETSLEDVLRNELYGLVRYVYSRRLAAEIIRSFEDALAARQTPAERIAICEQWIDFYRAHRYKKAMRRRRPTSRERLTPCSACGYPVSHRHHLWDVAAHGENKVTVQLCANCHELHHLLYNTLARESAHSRQLVQRILNAPQTDQQAVQRVLGWCRAIMVYEVENGWLERYKTSDEWIERCLNGSDAVSQKRG